MYVLSIARSDCCCWSVPSEWFIHVLLDIFTFEEDVFELIEVKAAITNLVVPFDHLLDLFHVHLSAQLLHCQFDVLRRDLA